MKILAVILSCFILLSCSDQKNKLQQPDMRLWYEQPAGEWTEALPVGNGRLGAMVFGDPLNERIQLNEESLWAGQPIDNNNPEALKHLPELQRALLTENIDKANDIVEKYFIGVPPNVRSYQTAGDIFIRSSGDQELSDYKRELVLETGISRTTFKLGDTKYVREVFASAPDNVIVIYCRAKGSGKINNRISLVRSKDAEVSAPGDDILVMKGQIVDAPDPKKGPGGKHMRFAGMLKVKTNGGEVTAEDSVLVIKDAKEFTILLTIKTDYDAENLGFNRSLDPLQSCRNIITKAEAESYTSLRNRHIEDHSPMFNRVKLELPETANSSLPTDKRLKAVKEGKDDPALAALYFQYGRYLLMGSSRSPGVLPANLQGIWNHKYNAPWNSDFHTNINLQMNYWPAEITNLPECVDPLNHLMERLTVPGRRTATEMYGAGGWTFHHLTDAFGRTGVMDGPWGVTPMDGPWMTFPVYRHFEYTLDTAYLRKTAYPLMKGSARFVLDFLIKGPEGYLVTAPSASPENAYFIPGTKKKGRLTYAATMDIEIIKGLFENCIKATEILNTDKDLRDSLENAMKRLPPLRIGKNGTLQEWIKDYEEPMPGHRHISHLLALYPLSQIQINPNTPELFEAAKKTIERRLSNGGGHTGWSRAWIINFYDRLLMGEKAHEHLLLLLKKSTLPNLFDTHPPFQIDGNFGGTAAIAGMFLFSHKNEIMLLPALPSAWHSGSIEGLKAKGNITVDIRWKDNKLDEVVLTPGRSGNIKIVYSDKYILLNVEKGKKYKLNGDLKNM